MKGEIVKRISLVGFSVMLAVAINALAQTPTLHRHTFGQVGIPVSHADKSFVYNYDGVEKIGLLHIVGAKIS